MEKHAAEAHLVPQRLQALLERFWHVQECSSTCGANPGGKAVQQDGELALGRGGGGEALPLLDAVQQPRHPLSYKINVILHQASLHHLKQ